MIKEGSRHLIEKQNFIKILKDNKIYHSPKSLVWYYDYVICNGLELKDKKVLDIGGGSGLISFYAAVMGAKKVTLLEPMQEGSGNVMMDAFYVMKEKIDKHNRVELVTETIQNYHSADDTRDNAATDNAARDNTARDNATCDNACGNDVYGKVPYDNEPCDSDASTNATFDVIVSYNSVNHFDEQACVSLLHHDDSKNKYLDIFKKIYNLSNTKASFIIREVSPQNLYNNLGLKNPFARNIEWEKHHHPEIWAGLLEEAGFVREKLNWITYKQLKSFGKYVMSNRCMAYLTYGAFTLRVTRP